MRIVNWWRSMVARMRGGAAERIDRRRRQSRDEEIRQLQFEIDILRSRLKVTEQALEQQIEINRRDRERVAAETARYGLQTAMARLGVDEPGAGTGNRTTGNTH